MDGVVELHACCTTLEGQRHNNVPAEKLQCHLQPIGLWSVARLGKSRLCCGVCVCVCVCVFTHLLYLLCLCSAGSGTIAKQQRKPSSTKQWSSVLVCLFACSCVCGVCVYVCVCVACSDFGRVFSVAG